jgi:hypothetical protein
MNRRLPLQSVVMLPPDTLFAADRLAYQSGQFFGQLLLFIVAACLIASGRKDRREDGRGDGTVKTAVGAVLLVALVGSLLV